MGLSWMGSSNVSLFDRFNEVIWRVGLISIFCAQGYCHFFLMERLYVLC